MHVHINAHEYLDTLAHKHMHAYMPAPRSTHTSEHVHIYDCPYKAHTYTQTYMHTYIYAHKYTHVYMHTYICAHTQMNLYLGHPVIANYEVLWKIFLSTN